MKLSKRKKNYLLKFFCIGYFGIWLLFGFLYFLLFEISHQNFIFQDDIDIRQKISNFKEGAQNLKISDEVLYELISTNIKKTSESSIGSDWAIFLQQILISTNITHFSINSIESVTDDLTKPEPDIYFVEIYVYTDPNNEIKTIKENISIGNETYISTKQFRPKKDVSELIFVKQYKIMLKDITMIKRFINKEQCSPVEEINIILDKSLNFIEEGFVSFLELKKNSKTDYELIHFMYFSAVTITTLGYGDILPNSTIVRSFVMVESLLGIFFAGGFVSSLFIKEDEENSKLITKE